MVRVAPRLAVAVLVLSACGGVDGCDKGAGEGACAGAGEGSL